MIHAICDFCGKDVDRNAILITMTPFQNFARYHSDNTPYGHTDKSLSHVICSECRKSHGLPNPFHDYKEITEQKLSYETTLHSLLQEKNNKQKDEHLKSPFYN